MKSSHYIHWVWFIWLMVLTKIVCFAPTVIHLQMGHDLQSYTIATLVNPNNDPYLQIPLLLKTRDLRSWTYMKAVDRIKKNPSLGVNADALP